MFRQDIRATIREFVEPYGNHGFVVCTGYTSVLGIVALDELIPAGQPVTLIVGDMRPKYFNKATDSDRYKALRAINERPITVYNWYRKQPREAIAHGKAVVVVEDDGGIVDALVGSSNITINGLDYNNEIMVKCDSDYHKHLVGYIKECTSYQPATKRLERIICGTDSYQSRQRNNRKRPQYGPTYSHQSTQQPKSLLVRFVRWLFGR